MDIFNLNLLPTVIWHHLAADPLEKLRFLLVKFFSHKSDSRIAIVHLSVCLSVSRSPKPLSLKESCLSAKSQPISHHTNQPSYQSAIMPISHHATQPPSPPSQPLRIITIGHHAYQPSCPHGLLTYALLLQLLSHFGLFFLFRCEIKWLIWTYSIITCYQQSFGIIWQLTHMKNLKFFSFEIFIINGPWNWFDNLDIFNHNLSPMVIWHHLAAEANEKLEYFNLWN